MKKWAWTRRCRDLGRNDIATEIDELVVEGLDQGFLAEDVDAHRRDVRLIGRHALGLEQARRNLHPRPLLGRRRLLAELDDATALVDPRRPEPGDLFLGAGLDRDRDVGIVLDVVCRSCR